MLDRNISLENLDGVKLGPYTLRLQNVSQGRFEQEKRFELYLANGKNYSHHPIIRGTHFTGHNFYSPWLEMYYNKHLSVGSSTVNLQKKQLDEQLFTTLSALLPAGSHMMVIYTNHKETHLALRKGVPPPATYLGYLLWQAGCTWFKDWYFPEGGKEGNMKLQGNKAAHAQGKRKHIESIKKDLHQFLEREKRVTKPFKNARKRARLIVHS